MISPLKREARDGRAWPGAMAAAARAGLSRSRSLHDRDLLVRRGLLVVEEVASGGGRASTVALPFAAERFGRVLAACASRVGREVRFAEETERHAFGADPPSRSTFSTNQEEAAG